MDITCHRLFPSQEQLQPDISGYLRLTSRAEGLNVSENSQAKLDVSARAGFTMSEVVTCFHKVGMLPEIQILYISRRYFRDIVGSSLRRL